MKNRTTATSVKKHLDEVRSIVRKTQEKIEDFIVIFSRDDAKNAELYNDATLQALREKGRREASEAILQLKTNAIRKIEAEFVSVNSIIDDWTTEEIPEKAETLLSAFVTYGIKPTADELMILQESVQGSYLGGRILQGIASQAGFYDTNFRTLAELKKDIAQGKTWALDSVKSYGGLIENNKLSSANFGIDAHVENMYFAAFAPEFNDPTRDNPFTRLEAELADVTETSYDILPTKRRQLDELFSDKDEAERLRIALNLMESDNALKSLLPLYDAELYKAAYSQLSTSWSESLKQATDNYLQAGKTLVDARKAPIPSAS